MKIKIIWYKEALAFLRKIESNVSQRIIKKVKEIEINPKRYITPLLNMDLLKIRVGDYRLFVNYSSDGKEVLIHSIKHRKNAYKK